MKITAAESFVVRYEELNLRWPEERLDPDDVSGHARLASATAIPSALGEHVYSRTAFRDFIERGGIGYVQADVTRLGGITAPGASTTFDPEAFAALRVA